MTQLRANLRLNEIPDVRFVDPSSLANTFYKLYQEYKNAIFINKREAILEEAYQLIKNLPTSPLELPKDVFTLKDLQTHVSKNYILFHMQRPTKSYPANDAEPYIVDDLLNGIADNSIPILGITSDDHLLCIFVKEKTVHNVYMMDALVDAILTNVPEVLETLKTFSITNKYNAMKLVDNYMKGLKYGQYPLPKGTRQSSLLGGLMPSDGTKNCGIRKRGLPRVGAELLMPHKKYIVKCENSNPSEAILIEILRRKYWPEIPFVKTIAIAQSRYNDKGYQVMDIVQPITGQIDAVIAKYKTQYLYSSDLSDSASRDQEWEARVRMFMKQVFMHVVFFVNNYNKTLFELHERGLYYEDQKLDNIAWDDKHRFVFLDTELSFAKDSFKPVTVNTLGFHHEGSVISNLVPYSLEKTVRDDLFRIMTDVANEINMPLNNNNMFGGKKKSKQKKTGTTKK